MVEVMIRRLEEVEDMLLTAKIKRKRRGSEGSGEKRREFE